MNLTTTKIYWLFTVCSFGYFCLIIFFVCLIASILCLCFFVNCKCQYNSCGDKGNARDLKLSRELCAWTIGVTLITGILTNFMPSPEVLKYMYIVPALTQNKLAKNLPDYANEFIKLELDKLRKDANEG